MWPSAATGHYLLIRDGFGYPVTGRASIGVSIGSVVTGRVVNIPEIPIKELARGIAPGFCIIVKKIVCCFRGALSDCL